MDWQLQLISLYVFICKQFEEGLANYCARMSNYADLSFTDEEIVTIFLCGIIHKHKELKDIYRHLTIREGGSVILTPADLSAVDEEDPVGSLTFNLQNIEHGKFEHVNNPGVEITSFTQQSLINGDIKFIHNGDEQPPGYDVSVSDSHGESSVPQPVVVTFIPSNDLPHWEKNILAINGGETKVLTSAEIKATDPDNVSSEIVIQVIEVSNGYFSFVAQPTVAITRFTQQDIDEGKVQFTHQGEEAVPAYILAASNSGNTSLVTQSGSITFIPPKVNDQSRIIIGASVGSALGLASILIGAGFFAKRKYDENTRKEHQLAHLVWVHLKLQNLSNFKTTQGKKYVQVVEGTLAAELKLQGIDVLTLSSEELNAVALLITQAAKDLIAKDEVRCGGRVVSPITAENLEANARAIAIKVCEYQEKEVNEKEEDSASIEMTGMKMKVSSED